MLTFVLPRPDERISAKKCYVYGMKFIVIPDLIAEPNHEDENTTVRVKIIVYEFRLMPFGEKRTLIASSRP